MLWENNHIIIIQFPNKIFKLFPKTAFEAKPTQNNARWVNPSVVTINTERESGKRQRDRQSAHGDHTPKQQQHPPSHTHPKTPGRARLYRSHTLSNKHTLTSSMKKEKLSTSLV